MPHQIRASATLTAHIDQRLNAIEDDDEIAALRGTCAGAAFKQFVAWFRLKAGVPFVLSALSLRFRAPALEARFMVWRRMQLEDRGPRALVFLALALAVFFVQDAYLYPVAVVVWGRAALLTLSALVLLLITAPRALREEWPAARALDNWIFDRSRERYLIGYQATAVLYGWFLVFTLVARNLSLPVSTRFNSIFSPELILFLMCV